MARDIEQLLAEMTVDEKAALTAGASFWTVNGVDRVGIPSIAVSDGPAGSRGPFYPGFGPQVPTLCIPCGTAMGATFDTDLARELGEAVGHQARTHGSRILLAPTVNLHRSPLYGRAFECYGEDPLHSGKMAAAFIGGVQSQHVATTVKHLVGNDAEFERMTIDSVIDERTLREIYLLPFEIAITEGGSLGVMTSYNRMNGSYCAENRWLLADVLRGEWGFQGLVITDWFAGMRTEQAAEAGVNIEMPFHRSYGRTLAEAVKEGRVDEALLDRAVLTTLGVLDRLGALDDEPTTPQAVDLPSHRAAARRASSGSIVLLRNEPVDGSPVLPLSIERLTSIALIGPNAARARIMGGGSAEVVPHHRTTIMEALRERLGDRVSVHHEPGCSIDRRTPVLNSPFRITVYDGELGDTRNPLTTLSRDDGRVIIIPVADPGVPTSKCNFTAVSEVVVAEAGDHIVSLIHLSPTRVLIDGECVIDCVADPAPRGDAFFGMGSREVTTTVHLTAGTHTFTVECDAKTRLWTHGAQIGLLRVETGDPVADATRLAAECDVAVVVVGTNSDWESEGHDRTTLDLPGRQVELVRAVAQANPRTVVLVNSGAPVDMSWSHEVPGVMQVWFGGQEMGHGVTDVLLGDADPGGRLPTTIPERLEHTPAFGNFPGEHGRVRYGEGLLMGYRWYQTRHIPVRYPFGFGLSYTTFDIGEPSVSATEIAPGDAVTVTVPVTNSGARPGSHVVQVYVSHRDPAVQRPESELKGFAKVHLAAGETTHVTIELPARAFAYWDPGDVYRASFRASVEGIPTEADLDLRGTWRVDAGNYEIRVGSSSEYIHHTASIEVR